MEFTVGQRVKALPGKVFKSARYGKVTTVLPGNGIYCVGSGEKTGVDEIIYTVSFTDNVHYAYSKAFLRAVKEAPKKSRRRSA